MDKKKKIVLISVIAIIVIAIVVGTICYFVPTKEKKEVETSKLNQVYETLQGKNSYSFTTTLDDNNKMYYAKQDDKAYTDTTYQGDTSKFIIRDGNSYLILEDREVYYTYANNETDLNKVEVQLEELKEMEYEQGEEKIENTTYTYEEYQTATNFMIGDISEEGENEETKTRFYFKNNKLVYIKTIIGDKQELLKVEISDKVDSKLFEIPSNYKAM